jgi:N6-L-threonylcarbamoyladenine synthase
MKDTLILGIESSCDETSVAIVKNGRDLLSNVINSQIKIHELYGGVVPEIASRCHTEVINEIMKEALKEANVSLNDIDGIAVTYGPGLVGALLVGVSYAKGLSFATGKPLIPVNHIEGHIAANYITHKDLKPPFICLIMSGGHTHLVNVKSYTEFEILGKTRDDAIGEAFDKVARVVGLGYPGGPKVDNLAKEGNPTIKLPVTHFENLDFSFSGIKTAVINLHHKDPDVNKADLCASFQKAVTEMLIINSKKAINEFDSEKIVIAGGVSRNSYIRKAFDDLAKEMNIKVYYPEPILCTDNAAMIAACGYYDFIEGKRADLNLNAIPNLKIGADFNTNK